MLSMTFKYRFAISLAVVVVELAISLSYSLAAEPSPDQLIAAERADILAELQPLQDQLAALRKAPNVSPDRWADAQIFVKAVVWALDFGPLTDTKGRELVRHGLVRARQRIEALS